MPGYGGQTIALDGNPFNLNAVTPLLDAAKVQEQQNQNQLLAARLPLEQAYAQQQQLATAQMQREEPLQIQATNEQRMAALGAQVRSAPDPAAAWDDAIAEEAKTNPLAKQWAKLPWSPLTMDKFTGAYGQGAPQPQPRSRAAASGQGAPAGQGGADAETTEGGGGAQSGVEDLDRLYDGVDLPHLQQAQGALNAYRFAALGVLSSRDPAAALRTAARALGHPEFADFQGDAYTAAGKARQVLATVERQADYLNNRVTLAQAGVPSPLIKQNIDKVGDSVVAINPYTRNGQAPTATPLYVQPKMTYAGVEPGSGKPILFNEHNPQGGFTEGPTAIGAKPVENRTATAFIYNAWLQHHPGDYDGATAATRNGGRGLSYDQKLQYAQTQAGRDYFDAIQAGQPVGDQATYLRTRTQQIMDNFATAPEPGAPAAGGGGAANGGPVQLQPRTAYNPAQHPKAPRGDVVSQMRDHGTLPQAQYDKKYGAGAYNRFHITPEQFERKFGPGSYGYYVTGR